MEADIVCDANVFDGDLAGSILVEYAIGLVDHIEAALIKLPSDSAQKLIEGQHTILVRIEMLNNLSDLNF